VGRSEVTNREIENLASVAAEILERGVSPSSIFTTTSFERNWVVEVFNRGKAPLSSILPLPLLREGGQGDRLPDNI
jgi:hypothetical protein